MIDASRILGIVARPLLFCLYLLSGLCRRKPTRWVFGGWSGYRYADNSAALFEYAAARPDHVIEAIWISHDHDIVARLRGLGYTAYHAWSPAGMRAVATSGVYIYDGLTKDINHWLSRGARKVLLRHGVGAKRIERAIDNRNHHLYKLFYGNLMQRLFWAIALPWHLVRPDMIIATSPEHGKQGELYYGVGPEQVAITGFPRNDRLLKDTLEDPPAETAEFLDASRAAGRTVWLYMPTFRDHDANFDFPVKDFVAIAKELSLAFLVKLHFVDSRRQSALEALECEYMHLIDPRSDANALYRRVDGLISDYSSATFDFILTGNPIILFTPDLEEYLVYSRTLYYPIDETRPGPRVETIDQLRSALRVELERGKSGPTERYLAIRDRFHVYQDGNACRRTFDEICRRCLAGTRAAQPATVTVEAEE